MTKYKFISILALLIVLMPFGLKAQGVGIAFEQNISVSQLLEKAKAQGKMAFIDCYTTWCGPCRKMSKEIFPQKIVGDYFNKHFVSLKLDMEKGEGPNRQKEWDVNAYPTLIFLNSDGSLAFRTVGSMDADKLIAEVKTLMKSHGKSDAQRKWENGDHSTEVASAYIAELQKTRQEQAIDQVISIWALESREVILHDSTAFKLFITHVSDPHAEVFTYLYSHADELRAQQGQQEADQVYQDNVHEYEDERDQDGPYEVGAPEHAGVVLKAHESGHPHTVPVREGIADTFDQRNDDRDGKRKQQGKEENPVNQGPMVLQGREEIDSGNRHQHACHKHGPAGCTLTA